MFEGPKDIPETMVQASAAACRASAHVAASAALSRKATANLSPERDVTEEEPRVGVFICDCGENIGGVIDIPELAAFAAKLAG